MPALQTIYVETEFDIMFARRMIRDMARGMGFAPCDQARVSLATSSLAHFMDLGGEHHGAISFQAYKGNGQSPRMQVVCTRNRITPKNGHTSSETSIKDADSPHIQGLEKIKGMVDDLRIEALPPEDIQVTLTKYRVSGL
jgi:hypothetical protein